MTVLELRAKPRWTGEPGSITSARVLDGGAAHRCWWLVDRQGLHWLCEGCPPVGVMRGEPCPHVRAAMAGEAA